MKHSMYCLFLVGALLFAEGNLYAEGAWEVIDLSISPNSRFGHSITKSGSEYLMMFGDKSDELFDDTYYFAVDPPDGLPTAEVLDSVVVNVE